MLGTHEPLPVKPSEPYPLDSYPKEPHKHLDEEKDPLIRFAFNALERGLPWFIVDPEGSYDFHSDIGSLNFLDEEEKYPTRYLLFETILYSGFVVHDEEKGWSSIVEPGGEWDKLLHAGRKICVIGGLGRDFSSVVTRVNVDDQSPSETLAALASGRSVFTKSAVNLRVFLHHRGTEAGPGEEVTIPGGETVELKMEVSGLPSDSEALVISGARGVAGDVLMRRKLSAGTHVFAYRFESKVNTYFRVLIRKGEEIQAVSNPIYIQVGPSRTDEVEWIIGEVNNSHMEFGPFNGVVERGAQDRLDASLFPGAFGPSYCQELSLHFTPMADAYYIFEISLRPEAVNDVPVGIDIMLGDQVIGRYRAHPWGGSFHPTMVNIKKVPPEGVRLDKGREFYPKLVSLGWLQANNEYKLRLRSLEHDKVYLEYMLLIRTSQAWIAKCDLHHTRKYEENWGLTDRETAGYNYVSEFNLYDPRGHIPVTYHEAIARSQKVSDPTLCVTGVGLEIIDTYGGTHLLPLSPHPKDNEKILDSIFHAYSRLVDVSALPILAHPHLEAEDRRTFRGRVYEKIFQDYMGHGLGVTLYWWLVPLFEIWNCVVGEYEDGMLLLREYLGDALKEEGLRPDSSKDMERLSVITGRFHRTYEIWNEMCDRFLEGSRDLPLYATSDNDWHFIPLHRASYVYTDTLDDRGIRQAMLRGQSTVSLRSNARLLLTIIGPDGTLYYPGFLIPAEKGKIRFHFWVWMPGHITVTLVSNKGEVMRADYEKSLVRDEWEVELSGPAWYRVQAHSTQSRNMVISNPVFAMSNELKITSKKEIGERRR